MYWLMLLAEIASHGALIFRSIMEIRKPVTSSRLFLNWELLFVLTTLQSIYFYFVTEPRWSILLFLLLNMFVVFMPAAIAAIIDARLKALHLEILYDIIRGKLVNIGFRVYLANTRNIMGLLDESEKRKFKELLTTFLDGDYSKPVPYYELAAKPRTFDDKEVHCTLLQPTQMSSIIGQRPVLLKPSRDQLFQPKNKSYERPLYASGDVSNEPFRKMRSPEIVDRGIKAVPPPYMQPPQILPEREKKAPYVSNSKIITAFGPAEADKEESLFRRSATDTASFQNYKELNQRTGKLIDELNMSVSEYSDILDFGDEPESTPKEPERKLLTTSQDTNPQHRPQKVTLPLRSEKKTEVIVPGKEYLVQKEQPKRQLSPIGTPLAKCQAYIQMGSKNYPRLEKYYVELYPNDIMQIVSMHGRIFERHTLREMRRQDNDYYEMAFAGDSMPQSRVLKFKTDMGEFRRYNRM